jgi:hypothetical protein
MPINKIYIGTSLPKSIYVGTSQAKMVYVGTNLVYTRPQTVSLTLNTGVASIQYSSTEADGTTGASGTATASTSVTVGYGSVFSAAATAATGYTINTSTYGVTVDGNESWSPTATRKTYTVTISKGTGVSSFSWTVTKWNGGTTTGSTSPVTVEYGDSITITGTATSAAYNTPSSITYSNITANKTASLTTTYKTFTVTISKGTGVNTVTYDVYNESGTKTSTGLTSTTCTVRYGGKVVITGATVNTGYNAASYTATTSNITSTKTISVTTTRKTFTVTISKGTGISSFSWTRTKWSGGTTTGTTSPVTVEYGDSISVTGTASTGYQNPTSLSYSSITANKSGTLTATPIPYTVTIRIRYNNTTYTSKVGTVTGTYSNTSGGTSNISGSHGCTITVPYKGQVNLTSTSPVAGFAYSSGATTYTITGNTTIDVVFVASTSTTTFTINNGTATTNTISKNAFTVTASLSVNLGKASSGATLATVPANYRPASNRTYTNGTTWYTAATSTNGSAGTTTPTITVATSGAVSANKQSYGTISLAAGGKWGGSSWTAETVLSLSNITWSVV